MDEYLERNKMLQALDWIYEKTLDGLPGTLSAEELAADYLSKNNYDPAIASKNLVNWQAGKCGTSGFVTGLGGIITLPIAIPANISSVLYIQMRMIAAIAHIGDYDIKSDQVKSLVYMCLVGIFFKCF